jgi:GNAT superfamily N-acetyltransferase
VADIITEKLRREHVVDGFTCGIYELDRYLTHFALQNQTDDLGTTYVIARPAEIAGQMQHIVYGYYTISMSKVKLAVVPEEEIKKGTPKYDRSTVLLGKFAIDKREQKKKMGIRLLWDALIRAEKLAGDVGCVALEVDALNDRAKDFYLKYGFLAYKDEPRHLFLPMATIREMLNSADERQQTPPPAH